MHTLLQLIKMIKLKNLLACGILLMAGSVFAQFEPPPAPTMKALVAGGDALNVTNPAGGSVNLFLNDFADAANITAADLMPMGDLAVGLISNGGLSVPTNLSLDGTNGVLTVLGSPAPGVYTVTYQVCQPILAPNCSNIASVNVTVTAAAATLVATADAGNIVAGVGGTVSILANDTSNAAAATTANVLASIVTPVTGFSINGSGQLAVATTVTAGSYPVTYKICEVGNLTNCSATVTVTVTVTAAAATLVATADAGNIVAGVGGTVNILANDTSNAAAATTTNVVARIVTIPVLGFSINGAGQLAVVNTVGAGSYPVTYKICEVGNLTNCSATVTVTVTVTAEAATLVATADAGNVVAGVGGTVSILANDTSNAAAATTANVLASIVTPVTGFSINGAGQLAVATTVTAGSYPVTYKICEVGNLTNCSATVTVTVTVTAAVVVVGGAGLVLAVDAITMPVAGGSLNVLTNDRYNSASITPTAVTLTLVSNAGISGSTLSALGDLFIPTSLSQRAYLLTYKVCLISSPTTCATTTVSIVISAAVTSSVRTVPSVPGASSSNSNVITTNQSVISFGTGSGSGGSTVAGGGSINDLLTFTGAKVSFGENLGGFALVNLYASQEIPKFVAQLNYNGSGQLNARWEVIRPGDFEPAPLDLAPEGSLTIVQKSQRRPYTFIERVSGYMLPTGSYLIAGPDTSRLPKSIPGLYRVLLRIEGAGSFAMPMLGYRVRSGTPPVAAAASSTGRSPVAAAVPQISVASINTTSPSAGAQIAATGMGVAVTFAWNWGASQSTSSVARWQYEISDDASRLRVQFGGTNKPDARAFRLLLNGSQFVGKNLRWVVVGRDKDNQIIARSSDMFFSISQPVVAPQ